jgi:hypothetical protein
MRPPQFGADITNQANNEPNLPAVMHCTRMAGRAIIRVVGRCNDAQENNNLGKYLKKNAPLVRLTIKDYNVSHCNHSGIHIFHQFYKILH